MKQQLINILITFCMTLLFGHTDAFPIKDTHQIFQDDQLYALPFRAGNNTISYYVSTS